MLKFRAWLFVIDEWKRVDVLICKIPLKTFKVKSNEGKVYPRCESIQLSLLLRLNKNIGMCPCFESQMKTMVLLFVL